MQIFRNATVRVPTLVKIPTPHSIPILARKRSSAKSRSLNPPKRSNHAINGDFSSSKYLNTMDPGILPSSIAAFKSFGKLSNVLPAKIIQNFRSVNADHTGYVVVDHNCRILQKMYSGF